MLLLILLVIAFVPALHAITLDEFKARSIPAFAEKLKGQDLVDYLNIVQPFFKAGLSMLDEDEKKALIMDERFLEMHNTNIPFKEPETDNITIPDKCSGGWKDEAWQYSISTGICTGGAYGKKGVCKSYPFHPCGYHKDQPYYGRCPKAGFSTPACKSECQPEYLETYQSDKIYGKTVYYVKKDVETIQKEIMLKGPVLASFTVYEDFYKYKGGIYVHTAGQKRGGHAVKVIGWGIEQNTPYWIVANSWGKDWGEHGIFRIVRGKNECNIEGGIVAGTMKV